MFERATHPALSRLVQLLIEAVDTEVERDVLAERIATTIQRYIPEIAAELPSDTVAAGELVRMPVHEADDGSLSIVLISWGAGATTPIHDHLSWCVVGVVDGEEVTTRFDLIREADRTVLRTGEESVSGPGSTAVIVPPNDIHRVENRGDGTARSLHVYGVNRQAPSRVVDACTTACQ